MSPVALDEPAPTALPSLMSPDIEGGVGGERRRCQPLTLSHNGSSGDIDHMCRVPEDTRACLTNNYGSGAVARA